MTNEYDFLKKQRYEYYKGKTEIMDNEVNELVEDIVDVLNKKDYNIIELLKIKQIQSQRILELEEQLKNAIVPKFKMYDTVYTLNRDRADGIESGKITQISFDGGNIIYQFTTNQTKYCHTYTYKDEEHVFATKEEAQAKLKKCEKL